MRSGDEAASGAVTWSRKRVRRRGPKAPTAPEDCPPAAAPAAGLPARTARAALLCRRRRGAAGWRRRRGGAAGLAVAAGAAGADASSALMMSDVRSMVGSAHTRPLSVALKTMCTCFSLATLSSTGLSLRVNSSCSCCCSACRSCCASSVKRWMSRCCRSTSAVSWARAVSFSTLPPESSFCCADCSALFFSFSSRTFWSFSALTRSLSALPSLDSAAMRSMRT